MSRCGVLALTFGSLSLVLVACGDPFTAVVMKDAGAGAPSDVTDGGAKSFAGSSEVLTRSEGGDTSELVEPTSGGDPSVLDSGGAPSSAGGAPDGGGALRCPDLEGEKLVLVDGYCIDENEVTAAHYQAFVDGAPALDAQPLECASNVSFANGCKYTDPTKQPARCMDWCDARAYCESVGKQLCGSTQGGAMAYDAPGDSTDDQWYSACSHVGERAYPYGDEYDATACWGGDHATMGAMTVKSANGCEGGFDGVFDLSGGMAEWVDSCNAKKGMTDACRIRGGSSSGSAEQLRCDRVDATARNTSSSYIGFRCCAAAIQ